MLSRFQADAVCLVETQMNPALTPCTFSIRDKLFGNKELVTTLLHNKQEHLGMRQQGGVFTGVIGQTTSTAMPTGSGLTGLRRWNWMQLKVPTFSTYIITAYQCVRYRSIVGTAFMQRERHVRRNNVPGC